MSQDLKSVYDYGKIKAVALDGQAMVFIPKFYIKVASGPDSSQNAGKRCIWITPYSRAGFHIHPAFVYQNKVMDGFYMGAYEASMEGYPNGDRWDSTGKQRILTGIKACSLPNVHVWNYIFKEEASTACKARNTGTDEQAGWHLQNIYEREAIAILMLLEYGRADVVNVIGGGNTLDHGGHSWTTNNPHGDDYTKKTGATNATWRGLHEWWGNCWESVDGVTTDTNGQLLIFSNRMDGTYVETGVKFPAADATENGSNGMTGKYGYIKSLSDASGEKFDLKDIFCPSVLAGNTNNKNTGGSLHDGAWWRPKNMWGTSSNINYHPQTQLWASGGFGNPLRYCGPFMWDLDTGNAIADSGFRLAKYGAVSDEVAYVD